MDASQSGVSTGSLGGPTTTNSGNPTYSDASAGPQTPTVPNAKPYGLTPKKKKKMGMEMLPFQPSDPEIDYVSSPIPKQCGTCEYFMPPSVCTLPLSIPVDPVYGCCNQWEPKDITEAKTTLPTMKYCAGCNKGHEDKVTVCDKCSSTEFSTSPKSKYTISG